jgi:hypothetical protein
MTGEKFSDIGKAAKLFNVMVIVIVNNLRQLDLGENDSDAQYEDA